MIFRRGSFWKILDSPVPKKTSFRLIMTFSVFQSKLINYAKQTKILMQKKYVKLGPKSIVRWFSPNHLYFELSTSTQITHSTIDFGPGFTFSSHTTSNFRLRTFLLLRTIDFGWNQEEKIKRYYFGLILSLRPNFIISDYRLRTETFWVEVVIHFVPTYIPDDWIFQYIFWQLVTTLTPFTNTIKLNYSILVQARGCQ